MNLRFNLTGGNRQSPIDLEASRAAGFTIRDYSRAWEEKLPDYIRGDIRISYHINSKKGRSSTISLDIQNVTNRTNVWRTFYSSGRDDIFESTQLGLIPILNYRLEF